LAGPRIILGLAGASSTPLGVSGVPDKSDESEIPCLPAREIFDEE